MPKLELANKTYSAPRAAWKCTSYPELNSGLYQHRLSEPSYVGTPQWQSTYPVVGTNDWYAANKGSIRRHARDPGRADWIWHSDMGSIQGQPSALDPPVFGWQPKVPKYLQGVDWKTADPGGTLGQTKMRTTGSSFASSRTSKSSKQGKSPKRNKRAGSPTSTTTSGSLAQTGEQTLKYGVSLPDLLNGDLRYPPSPAFVRNFLRTCDFKAKLAPLPGMSEESSREQTPASPEDTPASRRRG